MISRINLNTLLLVLIISSLLPYVTDHQILNAQSVQNFDLEGTVQSNEDNSALIGVTLELLQINEADFKSLRDNQKEQLSSQESLEITQNRKIVKEHQPMLMGVLV